MDINREKAREVNEKRLEELENLIENHTRTERHLEQYSDWVSDEGFKSTIDKQKSREENIESIENAIINNK